MEPAKGEETGFKLRLLRAFFDSFATEVEPTTSNIRLDIT